MKKSKVFRDEDLTADNIKKFIVGFSEDNNIPKGAAVELTSSGFKHTMLTLKYK